MSKSNFTKMESLRQKIEQLKTEKQKIQQVLLTELGQILDIKNAFKIDFDVLVGGFIHAIDKLDSNPSVTEEWRQTGQKFRKFAIKPRQTKPSKTVPAMA